MGAPSRGECSSDTQRQVTPATADIDELNLSAAWQPTDHQPVNHGAQLKLVSHQDQRSPRKHQRVSRRRCSLYLLQHPRKLGQFFAVGVLAASSDPLCPPGREYVRIAVRSVEDWVEVSELGRQLKVPRDRLDWPQRHCGTRSCCVRWLAAVARHQVVGRLCRRRSTCTFGGEEHGLVRGLQLRLPVPWSAGLSLAACRTAEREHRPFVV